MGYALIGIGSSILVCTSGYICYQIGYTKGCLQGWLYSKYRLTEPKFKLERAAELISNHENRLDELMIKEFGEEALREHRKLQEHREHKLN